MNPNDDSRCHAPPDIREVTDENKTRGIEVVFYVAVPAAALLAILWNVDNFPRLFPDVKEYSIEAKGPGDPPTWLDVRYRVDALVKAVRYVVRRTLASDGRSFTWREVSGDLRRVRGGWWVEETDVARVSRVGWQGVPSPTRSQ